MFEVKKAIQAELSALSGSHSKLQGKKLPNTFLLTLWEAWECLLTFERSSKQFSKLPSQAETVFYYLTESNDILLHFRQNTGHTLHISSEQFLKTQLGKGVTVGPSVGKLITPRFIPTLNLISSHC